MNIFLFVFSVIVLLVIIAYSHKQHEIHNKGPGEDAPAKVMNLAFIPTVSTNKVTSLNTSEDKRRAMTIRPKKMSTTTTKEKLSSAVSSNGDVKGNQQKNENIKKKPLSSHQSVNRDKNTTVKHYSPICDRLYKKSGSVFQDVVPRRAYYDNRTLLSGQARNLVIVLTEMLDSKDVEKSVLSCELDGHYSDVAVKHEDTCRWVRQNVPGYTHCSAYIHCTGFPKEVIQSGRTVKVIYKRKNDTCYSRVSTEKPLTLMKTGNGFTTRNSTVVVCSAFFGEPPYFNEWLKYQKALRVDMVHLNVEKSFADHAMTRFPFLKEALDSGFVHMEVWENYIGKKIFYYSQVTKYQDCVMRYSGVHEFALLYDSDDFFVPMLLGQGQRDIHDYTKKLFSDPHVGSVRLWWKKYVCKSDVLVYKTLPDGNVTQSLKSFVGYWYPNYNTKTVYRLHAVDLVGIHADYRLLPDYKPILGDRKLAYVAHLRPDDDECSKLQTATNQTATKQS